MTTEREYQEAQDRLRQLRGQGPLYDPRSNPRYGRASGTIPFASTRPGRSWLMAAGLMVALALLFTAATSDPEIRPGSSSPDSSRMLGREG